MQHYFFITIICTMNALKQSFSEKLIRFAALLFGRLEWVEIMAVSVGSFQLGNTKLDRFLAKNKQVYKKKFASFEMQFFSQRSYLNQKPVQFNSQKKLFFTKMNFQIGHPVNIGLFFVVSVSFCFKKYKYSMNLLTLISPSLKLHNQNCHSKQVLRGVKNAYSLV